MRADQLGKMRWCILPWLLPLTVHAADLTDMYNLALKHDLLYQQQLLEQEIVLENEPQARSKLLPQLTLDGNTTAHSQDISSSEDFGATGRVNFNSHGYNLKLTQSIFKRDQIIGLNQAKQEIVRSKARLMQAKQDLIIRVCERYFAILASTDNLRVARDTKKSLRRQLDEVTKRFEVGMGTITDLQEATAGYDQAVADEIQAINDLDNAREAMNESIDQYPEALALLNDDLPLIKPTPSNIEEWVNIALEQNINVILARHTLEIAKQEIKRQSAGRYPDVDLVANRGYNRNGGRFGVTQTHSTNIGIQLRIPIYQGGVNSSNIRKAHKNYNLVAKQFAQSRRASQRLARQSYLDVLSGISKIEALKQAVLSSETALKSTKAGLQVGTRTAVDVVVSERNTSSAKKDYAKARYDYVLNAMRLKQAVGILTSEDLYQVNQWLSH